MDSRVPCPMCGKELKITSIGAHVKNACPATKEARENEKREKRKKEQEERNIRNAEIRRENQEKKEKWHATAEWQERKKFKKEYPILFGQFKVLTKHIHCNCACSRCSDGWGSGCSCYLKSDKPWYK